MSKSSQPGSPSAAIIARDATLCFGEGPSEVLALDGVDLTIQAGEFVSLVGPSGCGKSTIIGAVAGFLPLTGGSLEVGGHPVRGPGPDRGVVFQQHTLFPWKTVTENVEFGLKMQGVSKPAREKTAREMLEHVGLGEFLRHYPGQLSGGMQQRVNLARVLVNRPRVILMDEPFGSLDAQTRLQMQGMLLELWHEFHMTIVFVTHDVDEAVFLGDRVLVLTSRPGKISAEISVDLPRRRNQEMLTSPEFMRLKRRTLDELLAKATPAVFSPPNGDARPQRKSSCQPARLSAE